MTSLATSFLSTLIARYPKQSDDLSYRGSLAQPYFGFPELVDDLLGLMRLLWHLLPPQISLAPVIMPGPVLGGLVNQAQ